MSTSAKSFWSGIPGLLTAIAGILTGVVGLGTLAYQLGVVGDKDTSSNGTTQSTSEDGGSDTSGVAGQAGESGSTAGKVSFAVDPASMALTKLAPEGVVLVINQGTADLAVKKAQLSGADADKSFSVDASNCTTSKVPAGKTCEIEVTYKGVLDATAKVTVTADGASAPENVSLKGSPL